MGGGGRGEQFNGGGAVGERIALIWAMSAFPLVMLSCLIKMRNGNCARECKRKSIPDESSQSGWRGVPSHKHVRVHNNFKGYNLTIKLKIATIAMVGLLINPLLHFSLISLPEYIVIMDLGSVSKVLTEYT